MASPKLTKEQAQKQKDKLAAFHANPDKPTPSLPRLPKNLNNLRIKFKGLSEPAFNLITKAVKGDLVAEKSVWIGTDEEKRQILETDASASFEPFILDNGKEIEVLVKYVSVNPKQVEMAKWIMTQEIALDKAVEDSKLRKLDIAMKHKKAADEGAIPKDGEAKRQEALANPGPKRLNLDFIPEEDEDE